MDDFDFDDKPLFGNKSGPNFLLIHKQYFVLQAMNLGFEIKVQLLGVLLFKVFV